MDCELTLPTGDNTAFPSPHSTRSFPLTPAGFELEAPHAEPSPALPARHKPLTVRGSRGQPRPGPTFEPAPRERARPARGGEYPRPPRRGHPGKDACTHWKAGAVPGIRRDSQGLGGGVAAIAPPRLHSAPIDSGSTPARPHSAPLGSGSASFCPAHWQAPGGSAELFHQPPCERGTQARRPSDALCRSTERVCAGSAGRRARGEREWEWEGEWEREWSWDGGPEPPPPHI